MSLHDYIIRDYTSADYDHVMNLWELIGFNSAGRNDDKLVIERTLSIGGKLLVLFLQNNKQLIGTSWLTSDGRRLYLHHFGIHPEYQGMGLSKILLDKSLEFAKEINQQIKLEVLKTNELAKNLYVKKGFKYLGDYEVYIIRDLSII